jgi:hypothetical protein
MTACDEITIPPPPEPQKQIETLSVFTKTINSSGVQTGLQSNDVYELFVPSTGELWIGNQGGIAIYGDPGSTTRTGDYNETSGLPNPKVRCMAEHNGRIYVGTWGGGIGVYDIAGATWMTPLRASANGLVSDTISDIKIHDDKLYISTIGGVSAYDPVAASWERYTKSATASVTGDLLDAYVSCLEVADTPRGTEYWYCPRWETGIDAGKEGEHGITVAQKDFNVTAITVKLEAFKDNTLYEDVDGALSNGAGTRFFAGLQSSTGKMRRGVIAFDLASAGIPRGAVIKSATLRLSVTTGSLIKVNMSLHRALADWGEGTSIATGDESAGAASTTGDATWKHTFYPGSTWQKAGGDYVLSGSGSVVIDTPKRVTWAGKAGMVADVSKWLKDPSSNFGWVVISDGEMKTFASSENASASLRPELEIVYQEFTYYTVLNSDLPAPNVNDIYYDASDDLFWIATATDGLCSVDVANSKWTQYTVENNLPSNAVYSMAKVGGTLWLGTQNGLAREVTDGVFQGYNRGGGLPADRVRRVYSDDGARLWLGFVEGGAARVNPASAE